MKSIKTSFFASIITFFILFAFLVGIASFEVHSPGLDSARARAASMFMSNSELAAQIQERRAFNETKILLQQAMMERDAANLKLANALVPESNVRDAFAVHVAEPIKNEARSASVYLQTNVYEPTRTFIRTFW